MMRMFISDCLDVNSGGRLTIGGLDTLELAARFGTPLYVMDENEILRNCRRFTKSMEAHYGSRGAVAYASKAFMCKGMCRLVNSEGMYLDVVSQGELLTAELAGFPMERVIYHGNNKTPAELANLLRAGVGRVVADNIFELEMLTGMAAAAEKRVKVMLRIKPGVQAHTHEFITTGGIDSKFGFALETGEAIAAVRAAKAMENIELCGLHCHIGSQIFARESFSAAAEIMLGLFAEAGKAYGKPLAELNLGGGFGVKYLEGDNPAPLETYMETVAATVKQACARLKIETPFIFIEPGRSVVNSAGITLYQVGAVKEIPGIRTYVTVDGGLADNPRPGLYGAKYSMLVANRAEQPADKIYAVSGRCCESDPLGTDIPLQEARVGDILAVLGTGAYTYSMAGNYNRLPKPAVVFVKDGAAREVVRRESLEHVIENDL
jgi:diaminopimelate decarboxylase